MSKCNITTGEKCSFSAKVRVKLRKPVPAVRRKSRLATNWSVRPQVRAFVHEIAPRVSIYVLPLLPRRRDQLTTLSLSASLVDPWTLSNRRTHDCIGCSRLAVFLLTSVVVALCIFHHRCIWRRIICQPMIQ